MNILIVEDHPLTAAAYCDILAAAQSENLNIVNAIDCKQAYNALCELRKSEDSFQLAVIDYSIPACPEKKLFSGADVALLVQKCCADCKLFIITAHCEVLVIYDLIRRINPLGIATKNELTSENLNVIFEDVLDNKLYRSPHVKLCVEMIWERNITMDAYNREIINYLGKGYRIKDLENVVNLSAGAIQNRILKLKKVFNAKDERELLKKLYDDGFL